MIFVQYTIKKECQKRHSKSNTLQTVRKRNLFGSPAVIALDALDPWLCVPGFLPVCLSRSCWSHFSVKDSNSLQVLMFVTQSKLGAQSLLYNIEHRSETMLVLCLSKKHPQLLVVIMCNPNPYTISKQIEYCTRFLSISVASLNISHGCFPNNE